MRTSLSASKRGLCTRRVRRSCWRHPLSPAGAARKKIKWTGNQFLVRPSIVCPLKFNFLQAAPAGISGCGSLERLL
ncbi:MAG: hypothetical protein MPL62_06275 [Alphaproteobacteria bacterium]|nr:hypothetical protein [Alphaproteobacteria bacterium]